MQLRRHDGAAPVCLDGPALLSPAGREPARPHPVLLGRQGRAQDHARRLGRHGPGARRRGTAHPDLGLEPDRVQPALLDALPGGEAARRETRRDRPVAQPDRGEVPPACAAPARHRRCARARDDARHHRRAALRPRLRRASHAGLRRAGRARAAVPSGARRAHLRHRAADRGRARARVRPHETRGDPAQLRHAAPPRWRHGRPDDRVPAGAGRRVARRRRGRAARRPTTSTGWTTPRSSAPT